MEPIPNFTQQAITTITESVGQTTLTTGEAITGIQVKKTTTGPASRYTMTYNGPFYFSLDCQQEDLPKLTELLLWLRDNLP